MGPATPAAPAPNPQTFAEYFGNISTSVLLNNLTGTSLDARSLANFRDEFPRFRVMAELTEDGDLVRLALEPETRLEVVEEKLDGGVQ
jgi:hypothetical protein